MSDNTRAPCEPPVTSTCSLPSSKSGIGALRRLEHRRAQRIAGQISSWRESPRRRARAENRSRCDRRGPRESDWRGPSPRSARAARSGCRAASRRTPAARSDSRRSRRRPSGFTRVQTARAPARRRARAWRWRRAAPSSEPPVGVAAAIGESRRAGKAAPYFSRARIRDQFDAIEPACAKRMSERLRGKQMAAGAAGCDQNRDRSLMRARLADRARRRASLRCAGACA